MAGDAAESALAQQWFATEATTLGDRLTGAREAAGLTRDELAARLEVPPETVAAWEEDRAEPAGPLLQEAAEVLEVTPGWLVAAEGEGIEAPPEAVATGSAPLAAAERSAALAEILAGVSALRHQLDALALGLDALEKAAAVLLSATDGEDA